MIVKGRLVQKASIEQGAVTNYDMPFECEWVEEQQFDCELIEEQQFECEWNDWIRSNTRRSF